VAKAAMDTGVARRPISDLAAYTRSLEARIAASQARNELIISEYAKI